MHHRVGVESDDNCLWPLLYVIWIDVNKHQFERESSLQSAL